MSAVARGGVAGLTTGVLLLLAACSGGGTAAGTGTGAGDKTTAPRTETTTAMVQPPFVVEGRGRASRFITLPGDFRPLVLSAEYPKGDVLAARLRGEGFERVPETTGQLVFDGPRTSETAFPGIAQGRYRLTVTGTKGSWTLRFSEPDPGVSPPQLVRDPISGRGDVVRALHLDQESELRWEMQTDGLFLLGQLLGYGDAEGVNQFLGILQGGFLFEPGNRGLRSDGPIPAGEYLLVVDADGHGFSRSLSPGSWPR